MKKYIVGFLEILWVLCLMYIIGYAITILSQGGNHGRIPDYIAGIALVIFASGLILTGTQGFLTNRFKG